MKHSAGICVTDDRVSIVLIDAGGKTAGKFSSETGGTGPEHAWQAVLDGIKEIVSCAPPGAEISSCGFTSPGSRFIAVDSEGDAIFDLGSLGNDSLKEEVRVANEHAGGLTAKTGLRFDASSPLPRILRLKREHPEIYRKTRKFIPLSSFLTGRLTGNYFRAGASFGPGMGFDSVSFRWHRFLKKTGILTEALPDIRDHGESAGKSVSAEAEEAGIPRGASVSVPASLGMCGFISSGASEPGQWNSHLDERLVMNGPAGGILNDPLARIHYRSLERGSWAAEAVLYAGMGSIPERPEPCPDVRETPLIVCPPPAPGGGFLPFIPGEGEGFIIGKPSGNGELFSGYIEGLSFLLRWTLETLEEMGFRTGGDVFSTGWTGPGVLELMAAASEKRFIRPQEPTPEFGAALLGLVGPVYRNIPEAVRGAVRRAGVFDPSGEGNFRSKYRKFRRACRAIGYE